MDKYLFRSIFVPAIILVVMGLFAPFQLRTQVLGISRLFGPIENVHGEDLQLIPDTLFSEDLHYHAPSGSLFGASEGDEKTRLTWFPPIGIWKDPNSVGRGTIVVIDPKTLSSKRLTLRNYDGAFNTHGIDLYSPPEDLSSVYIVAVNHLPNSAYYGSPSQPKDSKAPKARSRLEVFHHKIGSSEATHLRSIWHPLIRTPNDIYIKSLNEIYVTNDHYYREGLMKLVEDVAYGTIAPWTDLIHLHISDPISPNNGAMAADDTTGVTGTVAVKGIHSNNGLGHGRSPSEILICRTTIGQLLLAEEDELHPTQLKVGDVIQLPCTLDNPSYFSDPYAEKTGRDASGYVLAGLARAIAFPNGLDPPMVWLVQPKTIVPDSAPKKDGKNQGRWTQKLIFQDDGHILRTASTAVLVAIDPDVNMGKKQAHLFVTGPLAKGVAVTKIDL